MDILNFSRVMDVFRGSEQSEEERHELFRELVVMVLSRATRADLNVKTCEAEAVQRVLKERFGAEVSLADIQVAAHSEAYETQPLERYVAAASRNLPRAERIALLAALADVIGTDERLSEFEIEFFDDVAGAMKATPSEIAGLSPAEY